MNSTWRGEHERSHNEQNHYDWQARVDDEQHLARGTRAKGS
ncbi:hypothetical protein [Enterococcus sp. LJL128]